MYDHYIDNDHTQPAFMYYRLKEPYSFRGWKKPSFQVSFDGLGHHDWLRPDPKLCWFFRNKGAGAVKEVADAAISRIKQ